MEAALISHALSESTMPTLFIARWLVRPMRVGQQNTKTSTSNPDLLSYQRLLRTTGSQTPRPLVLANGGTVEDLKDATQLLKSYPNIQSDLSGMNGYLNRRGGWADAAGSIQKLASRCTVEGVSIVTGPRGSVVSLRKEGSRVVGVNVASGDSILASQVILSTGAWTNRLLNIAHAASSSGQPVGFIQLTPKEARSLKHTRHDQYDRWRVHLPSFAGK